MCKAQGKKNKGGAWYCFPGEMWIGKKIGRSRVHISRSVNRLKKAGLIDIIRRRKVQGHWQTNLYRLSLSTMRALGQLKHWFSSVFCRVTSPLHIVQRPYIKEIQKMETELLKIKIQAPALEEIINRIENKNPELSKA